MTLRKRLVDASALGLALMIGSGLSTPPAHAAYIVTLTQAGSDVVATGSGLCVDPTDPVAIAAAVDRLTEDEEFAATCGGNGADPETKSRIDLPI